MSKVRVKVIINDGVTVGVLADGDVDVEIVDVDKDYEDADALEKYEDELRRDKTLKERDFTVAHFNEDGESDPLTHDDWGRTDMEEKKIIVETPLGSLVIYQSGDSQYPGVYIDLRRKGCDCDAPVAMVEYTATEGDLDAPAIITRIWDDVRQEEHQTRVVHAGIEEYFRE